MASVCSADWLAYLHTHVGSHRKGLLLTSFSYGCVYRVAHGLEWGCRCTHAAPHEPALQLFRSSSDEEDKAELRDCKRPNQTLLQGRTRRTTAGKRMAELINQEEDTDMYKEKFGTEVFDDSNSDFELTDEGVIFDFFAQPNKFMVSSE
jgi:hypothetical protein